MTKIDNPSPARLPSQKPVELPGRNTVYEPRIPGVEIPGQPLQAPQPNPDMPAVQDPPVGPLVM